MTRIKMYLVQDSANQFHTTFKRKRTQDKLQKRRAEKSSTFSRRHHKHDGNNFCDSFYRPVALIFCFMSCLGISLMPSENIVLDPQVWYEASMPIVAKVLAMAASLVAGFQLGTT